MNDIAVIIRKGNDGNVAVCRGDQGRDDGLAPQSSLKMRSKSLRFLSSCIVPEMYPLMR